MLGSLYILFSISFFKVNLQVAIVQYRVNLTSESDSTHKITQSQRAWIVFEKSIRKNSDIKWRGGRFYHLLQIYILKWCNSGRFPFFLYKSMLLHIGPLVYIIYKSLWHAICDFEN